MSLYYDLEDEVIADIARRVKKTMRLTETAELMAKSMVEQGYSAVEIRSKVMKMLNADKKLQMDIAENTKAHKQEIQDIITETMKEAEKAGEKLSEEAANMSWNNDLSMWEEHGEDLKKPNTLSQLMTAFRKQTNDTFRNLTKSTGFKGTNMGTVSILNAYQRNLDMALLKVATGTFSADVAIEDCVERLARSGLRSVDYASGKSYQLDTAVRMSVRTGLSQLAGKITEANLQSSGHDLVRTSQHMGSRPEHALWQNKVFSYSGKNRKYPDFESSTGYGTAAGLKGVNCTHDFHPYWEGDFILEDITEPEPVTINGKTYTYYQATQQMRKMERDIRATKRELEARNAIGSSTSELRGKLSRQNKEYFQFSKEAKIKPRENRLRVKYGSSDLKKTNSYKETKGSGALTNKTDPLGRKRNKHAESYYQEIRNRKPKYVIDKLAKNAEISPKEARKIYEHVFVDEHVFKNGEVHGFEPDYDMAESFRRIFEGKNIKPHDIIMLKHEKLELALIKKYNMVYEEAHELANRKYNYQRALDEFLEGIGG